MSALDDAIDAVRSRDMSGTMHATANAAEAELALLRRCREAVVAWLRERAVGLRSRPHCDECGAPTQADVHSSEAVDLVADAIERGEHTQPPPVAGEEG